MSTCAAGALHTVCTLRADRKRPVQRATFDVRGFGAKKKCHNAVFCPSASRFNTLRLSSNPGAKPGLALSSA
jgi:hypothetical protein